jgi:glycosyltransferase involved in cell wall biosynthesis
MLESRATELGLDGEILLTGFQEQVSSWLSIADCFVLPSLTEGTPMVLLEAMAMEVPVVATDVGGVPDVVVDGVNGLLVRPADADALQDAMSALFVKPSLREKYRREGRKTVESRFSVQPWCKKVLEVYLDARRRRHHRV